MQFDHEAIISHWNNLTAENAHGKALLFLARVTNQNRPAMILEHVNAIHDLEGDLPPALGEYRRTLQELIFAVARKTLGEKTFERLN